MLPQNFICSTDEYSKIDRYMPAPCLRKAFSLDYTVKKAEITICGLGFYKLYINGEDITKGVLAPYISNPDDVLYYDRYDITNLLNKGENVVGIMLGNGMLNCYGGYVWDFEKALWRSAPKVALQADIKLKNSDSIIIESDESFKTDESPIFYDDLRMGEGYDANKEKPGWNAPSFDDNSWRYAKKAGCPRGEKVIFKANPVVVARELKPVSITKKNNAYIYDFGVNLAGYCRLKVQGKKNQRIEYIHGEYIDNEGLHVRNIQFIRPEYKNLPPYLQKIEYICKGEGIETYTPSFTYHGFRYVSVTGITDKQATPDLLTYLVVHSDLKEMGSFTCSDETLNKLQQMTRYSTLSNFVYFPTDCPHREKNGWTADAALSAEHTLLNLNPELSYKEWLRNIRKAQNEAGAIPGIIPTGGWGYGCGPSWDSVLVWLPYFVYLYRNDKDILAENKTAIFRYVHYLTTIMDENGLIAKGLGDWCAPDHPSPKAPLELTASICSMDICKKAAYIFNVLKMPFQHNFCQKVADELRLAIRSRLIDFSTMTAAGSCQTSQAMAIFYDVFEPSEKARAFEVLADKIRECDNHIDTGVLGARVLFHVLTAYGCSNLAYDMITVPTAPSYGEWVTRGETVLCESFRTEYPRGDSGNHHFFGDISSWFIKCIAGIRLNPYCSNIKELNIEPHFISGLTHAKAFHEAPAGIISVEWANKDDVITLTVEIPEGMTGKIRLESGYVFKDGHSEQKLINGKYIYEVRKTS